MKETSVGNKLSVALNSDTTHSHSLRLAVTGFVSGDSGSMASANALLIQGLLARGCEVVFFSKSSFVDPRPLFQSFKGFSFIEADNGRMDRLRAITARVPGISQLTSMWDSASYNRLLVKKITKAHQDRSFDAVIWFGDYARGRVDGVPTMSFAQGPPGTDARAILRHIASIREIAGSIAAVKWYVLARLRLSWFGLPPIHYSDKILVGSNQSRRTLITLFQVDKDRVSTLPYPIDLDLFHPQVDTSPVKSLRCLWLGRIIPRKNLPLFLGGAALAIRHGADIRVSVVGQVRMIDGYKQLLREFPFPDRLQWIEHISRENVPDLLHAHDVLVQPSEEEDFGSSVAEAQAAGLPVVVGESNGNADYLCERDIHLEDYRAESLAAALMELAAKKEEGCLGAPEVSRACAEKSFSLDRITDRLLWEIMELVKTRRAHPATVQSPARL